MNTTTKTVGLVGIWTPGALHLFIYFHLLILYLGTMYNDDGDGHGRHDDDNSKDDNDSYDRWDDDDHR